MGSPVKFKTITAPSKEKFKYDKTKDNWSIHREGAAAPSGQSAIEAVPILMGDEKKIDGAVMLGRAAASKCAGQHLAEYLLDHQGVIPNELKGKILVFADTLWLDDSYLRVPFLSWDDGEWCLNFDYLDSVWDSDYMFVRLCA